MIGRRVSDPVLRRVFGAMLVVLGLLLFVPGLQLATLSGSVYYALYGALLFVSGCLIARCHCAGVWLYMASFIFTVAWAVAEVGSSVWLLLPRLDLPLALTGLLVSVWIGRPMRRVVARLSGPRIATNPLRALRGAAVMVLVALVLGAIVAEMPRRAHAALARILAGNDTGHEWRHYGNTLKGQRYAPIGQLHRDNVAELQVAWTYHTGEKQGSAATTFEATPIKIRDTLYFCTPRNVVIALDAETGTETWHHDPRANLEHNYYLTCRGVSYHEADVAARGSCPRRILTATGDARLIALDAETGELCHDFGQFGTVDLLRGLGEVKPGHYVVTSAPTIVSGLAIVGGQIIDVSADQPPGVVRAYDATTGALVWNWSPADPDNTAPLAAGETYPRGSPNAWAPASADEALGLVYLSTSVEKPDSWGGNRNPTAERFSSAIVALEVATGHLRWVYQTVHHDVWDMDLGAQPTLLDIKTDSSVRRVLVAATKRGDIFLLDRETGQPIVPTPEKPVPQGAPFGDWLSPTQPFSQLSLQPKPLSERDMWGVSPFDQLWCRIQFRKYRYQGIFTPQTEQGQGSLIYPGHYGVLSWGGVTVDEARQLLIATPNYVGYWSRLIPKLRPKLASVQGNEWQRPEQKPPYSVEFGAFLSPLGIPCNAPPWGEIAAIDLVSNQLIWRHALGTTRDQAPLGLALPLGVPSLGGPVLTAGGLAFMAGTVDDYLRAFDLFSGTELWRGRLPAGGQATPMTYVSEKSGRQFVIVAAGGHRGLGTTYGDSVVAFALPD